MSRRIRTPPPPVSAMPPPPARPGPMRCIIAGGRDINDPAALVAALASCPFTSEIREVISGLAPGVDYLGERWAIQNGIPVRYFKPDWSQGRKAGPVRNREMAEYAAEIEGSGLLAIWDGASPGTKDMIAQARAYGLRVHVHPHNVRAIDPATLGLFGSFLGRIE